MPRKKTKKTVAKKTVDVKKKSNKKVVKKFHERKEFQPVRKILLPHTINKRQVFLTQFKHTKYEFNDIKQFASKLKDELKKSGQVHSMQVSFGFNSGKHYSGKWSLIDEDLDIRDFRNLYNDDDAVITSFSIFIS